MNCVTLQSAIKAVSDDLPLIENEASIEARYLVCHHTNSKLTDVFAYPDQRVTQAQWQMIQQSVQRRVAGEPLAYVLGYASFWTLQLDVTPATLVPRSDTECLVEWVLAQQSNDTALQVADLGTGTGAIAIALATERPRWRVHATDQCDKALAVAKKNASRYLTDRLSFFQGDWCDALPDQDYDVMVSNPPYIAGDDVHLKALAHEPRAALIADDNGMADIRCIVMQARNYLKKGGILVIEHGHQQGALVRTCFEKLGYNNVLTHRDLQGIERFCSGYWM